MFENAVLLCFCPNHRDMSAVLGDRLFLAIVARRAGQRSLATRAKGRSPKEQQRRVWPSASFLTFVSMAHLLIALFNAALQSGQTF